jgi:hypothetical protein
MVMLKTTGTSAAASVMAGVIDAPLCLECLAKTVGTSPEHVWSVLAEIDIAVKITDSVAPCQACLMAKKVFRLA